MSQKLTSAFAPHNAALYCEDETEIARLAADFRDEHNPIGPTERFLVEQLARAAWRTRRYGRMELGLVDLQMAQTAGRLECQRTQDRDRANPEIHHNNTILLGAAFHEDCDKGRRAQERIARLQDAAERAFLRCLKALHDEQDRRCKAQVQPQPRVRRSAPAEAAAQASAGGQSNIVVLEPAAKTSAPPPMAGTMATAGPDRKRNPVTTGLNSPNNSDYSDGLPPAG